jgi:hypothetical protein
MNSRLERIAMPIIRTVVIVVVFQLLAVPLDLYVFEGRGLPILVHLVVAALAIAIRWETELTLLRWKKEAAERNEATSTLAVSFRTALGLGQLLEAVRPLRGYVWTQGQKVSWGRYVRGVGQDATITILCDESRYILEMEFPLDGPVKPSLRAEVFSAACQQFLPLMKAQHVCEEPDTYLILGRSKQAGRGQ